MIRTYSELRRLETFEERYEYLKLGGRVGATTFGFDRHFNQGFYRSSQWKSARREAIIRDNGCDLGVPGYEINGSLLVHHMNPVAIEDLIDGDESILDARFLITTTTQTHNAIHYGDQSLLRTPFKERAFGDTKLW
jgi:hypothetical protein